MRKLLLLSTMSLALTSFAFNNSGKNYDLSKLDEGGTCVYSITTYYSDGSSTTDTYSKYAISETHCRSIANNHAQLLRERL